MKHKSLIKNVGVGYEFSDVSSPESITRLKGGRQTGTHHNQDRVLELVNAQLPYGWQLYSSNSGIPLANVAPVTVTDSLINEMGAPKQGWFEVEHVQFAFAAVAAVGPSSRVHVRDSVTNSHTIKGNSDGVVKIDNSEIYGSRVQAIGHSRILLLNTALRTNERSRTSLYTYNCVTVARRLQSSRPLSPTPPARGGASRSASSIRPGSLLATM